MNLLITCSWFRSKLCLVRYQVIGDPKCRTGFALELIHLNLVHQFPEHQTLGRTVEDSEIGDDPRYTSRTSERECAFYQGVSNCSLIPLHYTTCLSGSLGFHCGQRVPRKIGQRLVYLGKFEELRTMVMMTFVFSGLATRSIAPPIPFTLPGSIKLAKSSRVNTTQKET